MGKTYTIGKSKLNLINNAPGEQKSAFKEELLRIVRDSNRIEYQKIIEEKCSYDFLHHLSDIRGNAVRWLSIGRGESVLELDAECGAMTGALLELSGNVTAVCEDDTDTEIIAERFADTEGLTAFSGVGLLDAIEPDRKYDWVIIKDVSDIAYALKRMTPKGHTVIITDNRMGLKNFAGVKALGQQDFFGGIEGKGECGVTLPFLKKSIEKQAGLEYSIYYPYPDYRFMKSLFSDRHLPKVGELINNDWYFESDRLDLFSEKEAFDSCCEDGSFPEYSNSYIAVIGSEVLVDYARFSNDRASEYGIYTTVETHDGEQIVRKYPLSGFANNHIRNLASNYSELVKKYAGSELEINKCTLMDVGEHIYASFEYVEGTELSKLMDDCLLENRLDDFMTLFEKYVELIGFNDSYPFADIDVVFSNILVADDKWTLIDYEWCKESRIPIREAAYRSIYCYLLEDKCREKINKDLILRRLELSKEASEEIELDEAVFQKKVTGKNLALCELREKMGRKSVNPIPLIGKIKDNSGIYKFRIYPGGKASEFSEETAFDIPEAYESDTVAKVTIPVTRDDKVLRVDPIDAACIVTIREAKLEELDFPIESKKFLATNGKRIGDDTFVFATSDPNMYFDFSGYIKDEDSFLYLNLEITVLSEDTAEKIVSNIKKFF